MINKIKRFAENKFLRNVAIVASGAAGAQVINLAFLPIITRLYGPEAFGVLGAFIAILAVLTPLAALSYPIAIVLPKHDVDAVGLAKLSIGIAILMSLLTMVILVLFRKSIINAFNLQTVEPFMLLLPLAMFFSVATAVMSQWVIRKKLFKIKAKVTILQALWLNSAKAGIGVFSPFSAVLVVLTALGGVLHAFMLWLEVRKSSEGRMRLAGRGEGDFITGKMLAWQHRDFAFYRAPQIVLNAASQSMPVLMLTSFFGPTAAGFYSLGRMALGLPTVLIGQSVASVFYPRFNEAVHNGENARGLLLKATAALAAVGLLPFGIVVAFGPWVFGFVFGDEWVTAGVYAQWLALWSYFGFINRPSIGAIPVLAMQRYFLIYEILSVLVRAVALFVGFWLYESALIAVAIFSIVSVVLNASLIVATSFGAHRHTLRIFSS